MKREHKHFDFARSTVVRQRGPRPRQLLAVAYALAAALWLVYCFVGCGVMLCHKLDGSMRSMMLGTDALRYSAFVRYEDLEYSTAPDERGGWYLSTDNDPQIIWQGAAYIETAVLQAEHLLPPGSVALYYLRPGQTEYRETQKVFARITDEGYYAFDLGGKSITALRIDPDSVGGVPTRLRGVELNPASPWYLRFAPNGGQWLVLLFAPTAAAALLRLVYEAVYSPRPTQT